MNKADFQKQFGKHLRRFREDKGISLREFEMKCDVNRQTLSKIELGELNPSVVTLRKICIGLDCNLSELFKGFTK